MNKKEAAKTFLQMIRERRIREAYDKYVAQDFIHHNLYFRGDRETLLTAMEDAGKMFPGMVLEIKRCLEDGDTVMTHSWVRHKPEDIGITVVHIFRFKNDKIVELWDLGQEIPKDCPNQYGAF